MAIVGRELDDCEDEILWLVERVENLVSGDGDGRRARTPALHLDEAQAPRSRNAALDVIAEPLELAVGRLETEASLDLHHDLARPRRGGLGVDGCSRRGCRPLAHGREQAHRNHQQAAEDDGRQRRDLGFEL
jgi:hypothetical protein